jgi:peptide/nickel transport system substrate-binding protein
MMNIILTFDRAKEASAIYDPVAVADFQGFMSTFNGLEIISEDPLVIGTYTNALYPDAEITAANNGWWPYYDQGEGAWHTLSLGVMAEAAGLGAFSTDKADKNEYTWFNYIAGETLDILKGQLDAWTESGAMPYEPTLSNYVDEDELDARLTNLAAFYDEYEHFWVGTGPLMLDSAYPVSGSLLLTRFEDYSDNAAKWLGYSTPQMAELAIEGEARVTIGEEAAFDLAVTFEGEPYAVEDVDNVTYLVLDASNNVAIQGEAEAVADGEWQVVLDAEQTGALPVGANSLEVVVVSNLVAVPTSGSFEFVTIE